MANRSGGLLPARLDVILALQFLMGLFAALVQMANTRLAMAVIPPIGRNHFFALYSVLGSVALGLSPVGWGLFLDAVRAVSFRGLGLEWNRYTLFFAAAGGVFLVALGMAATGRAESRRHGGVAQGASHEIPPARLGAALAPAVAMGRFVQGRGRAAGSCPWFGLSV